jgi:hypothetical protein
MKEGPSGSAIRSLIPSLRKLLWSKVTVSNGKQSGPQIGIEKGPLTGVGSGLSR